MLEGEGDQAAPRRVHLESLARQGDPEAEAELASIPGLPRLGAHVWRYFLDLCETRQNGPMGPSRLTRLDIRLWEEDEGLRLEPWERRTIIRIDEAWARIGPSSVRT